MSRGPVAALVLAAVAVYTFLALRSPLPVLFPDEIRYAGLARALADGHGLTLRGAAVHQPAALYLYVLAPAWALLSSTVAAFAVAKVIGTVALCAQAVAVWALARVTLRDERLALLPALLCLAGTWMLTAAGTTTEALAMPLTTAALCAAVAALRRPGSRWAWAALALVALAAWARIQLAAIVPALLTAIVLDVLRTPRAGRAARLRGHAPWLAATAALSVAGLVLVLAAPSVTGDYAALVRARPPLSRIAGRTGLQVLEVVALCGVLPFILTLAATLSPRAWRDPDAGPLLALVWPVIAVTTLQSGFFLADFTPATWGIQRYVFYAVPLLLVLGTLVAQRPRLVPAPALAAGAAVTLLVLLARPAITMIGEERAAWATGYRLHQLLGVGVGPSLALVALLTAGALGALRIRARGGSVAVGATAIVLLVLVVQSQASWHQLLRTTRTFRATFPTDLAWVDHHGSGPVASLALTQTSPQYADLELFNRDLQQVYTAPAGVLGPVLPGRRCTFRFALSGALTVQPGCGALPRRFLIDDPAGMVTFYDEVRSDRDPRLGRLVQVGGRGAPRARSVLILACPRASPVYSSTSPDIVPTSAPRACAPRLVVSLWLRRAGQLELRYRGGREPHLVTAGGRRFVVPAGAETTVRVPFRSGYDQQVIEQDWVSTDGAPQLMGAAVRGGGSPGTIL